MKHFTRSRILATLLILAPAANALRDYLSGDASPRVTIGATIAGCLSAAITYFMSPPRRAHTLAPLPLPPPGASER